MAAKLSENMSKLIEILCPGCRTEMELLFMLYLKDNELWMIGDLHWLDWISFLH